MKTYSLLSFLLISFQIYAQCTLEECGPPPMMPNYLCSDGVTVTGPGNCIQSDEDQCYWEIITCPASAYLGYLRSINASFCMDACAYYYLETEGGEFLSNVTSLDNIESLYYFTDRYVYLDGEEVWCVECGAVDVNEIDISGKGLGRPSGSAQEACWRSCPLLCRNGRGNPSRKAIGAAASPVHDRHPGARARPCPGGRFSLGAGRAAG